MSESFLTPGGIFADGYGFVPKMLMRDKRLTIEAKAIYSYLSSFAGAGMTAFPSVELIISELSISEDRFYKHRKLLIELGYMSIKQEKGAGKFAKNIYIISANIPHPCFTGTENPSTENAGTENKGANSNSLNNNNLNSNSKKDSAKKSNKKFDPVDFLKNHNVSDLVIESFLSHRKNKKADNSLVAMKAFVREAGKAGITVERALEISIERNWSGFNASWKWQDDAILLGARNETNQPNNQDNSLVGRARAKSDASYQAMLDEEARGSC